MRKIAAVLLLSIAAFPVLAEVYRWVDDKGVVHYTDKAPDKTAKPTELPPLQTYKPVPVAPPARAPVTTGLAPNGDPLEPLAKRATPTLRVVAPQQDDTIRDAEGKISVVIAANLQQGQSLVYTLDGQRQNTEPTLSTGYLLTGVERGEHRIGATLLDAAGKELARAEPVTIFMMPSVIRSR